MSLACKEACSYHDVNKPWAFTVFEEVANVLYSTVNIQDYFFNYSKILRNEKRAFPPIPSLEYY